MGKKERVRISWCCLSIKVSSVSKFSSISSVKPYCLGHSAQVPEVLNMLGAGNSLLFDVPRSVEVDNIC